MSVDPRLRRQLCIGVALLPMVVGCASPPPRVFMLAPREAAQPARSTATILVKSVEVAKYLDRPQIVRYGEPYELKLAEFERWGEGMQDMVMRVLVDNLSLRLPGSQVLAGSAPLDVRADATVELNVSRFDADPNGEVVLAALWVVQRQGRRAQLRSDRIRVPSNPAETPALVAAMSDALGQLSDRIALTLA